MPSFLTEDAIEQAMLQRLQHLYGYDVQFRDASERLRQERVRLIDFEQADNNRILAVTQLWIQSTGTSLSGRDRKTNEWFGDYVSEYNFSQSMDDGATVPVFYQKRVPEVLNQNEDLSDEFYEILEDENLDVTQQEKLARHFPTELQVIKRDDRLAGPAAGGVAVVVAVATAKLVDRHSWSGAGFAGPCHDEPHSEYPLAGGPAVGYCRGSKLYCAPGGIARPSHRRGIRPATAKEY